MEERRIISIEKLGEISDYVYDLEVDGVNNFFGNDILVHNSAIFQCPNLVQEHCDKVNKTFKTISKSIIKDVIKDIDKFILDEVNPACQREIAKRCFSEDSDRIEFKREAFSLHCAAFAKKKYFLHIVDKEGIQTDEFKYTGIEIKKNELPPKVKKLIREIYEDSCRKFWIESQYNQRLREIWEMFKTLDINEISYYKGYNTARFAEGFLKMQTGTTLIARAATYYNQLITKLNLINKYSEIHIGDKIRVCYLLPNQFGIGVIGFPTKFPDELVQYFSIDYITMFQKMILKPLDSYCSLRKWKQFDPRNEPCNDIFGIQ